MAPWGPSHQWADTSLRLHTFATVLGLTLVSLARIAMGTTKSARAMMVSLRHGCGAGSTRGGSGGGACERGRSRRAAVAFGNSA